MGKQSKNLAKVQSMLDGTYGGKIQSGYSPTEEHRKVGDKWTDSDGNKWEQKEGYRYKIPSMPSVGMFSPSLASGWPLRRTRCPQPFSP